MREIERQVVLSVLDGKWREHLYEMDYLQEGIGLRAMGQRDPLVEYQREGYDLFMAMMDSVKEEVVGFVFHAQLQQPVAPEEVDAESQVEAASGEVTPSNATPTNARPTNAAPTNAPPTKAAPTNAAPKLPNQESRGGEQVSRNDPCPCGSGKKFKRCHGDPRNAGKTSTDYQTAATPI
jgi:preprotein translocase subunit SecA